MLRFLLLVILIVAGVLGYLWFSMQSMPDWYNAQENPQQVAQQRLSQQIEQQGAANFLGDKFSDLLSGEMTLNEDEFNALLMTSLRSDEDGRRLLAVTDGVHADLRKDEIEVGAVVNLSKLKRQEPEASEAIDQLRGLLPLGGNDHLYIAVLGQPIARRGNLALADGASLRLGAIPISNQVLKSLGVPVEKISEGDVALRLLRVKSVTVKENQIHLNARPRF